MSLSRSPVAPTAPAPDAHAPAGPPAGLLAGPVLHLRGFRAGRLALAAVAVAEEGAAVPELVTDEGPAEPRTLHVRDGLRTIRWSFTLPAAADASYALAGETFPVSADPRGDLRLAFVSCNGQEHGDRDRPRAARNRMWARLAANHARSPYALMLHGGDQIYADEVLDADPLARAWREGRDVAAAANDPARLAAMADALRRAFRERYIHLLAQPEIAWCHARIPSLAIWDDHDIVDGWGSLPEGMLDSPVGRTVFGVAREAFLLFQLGEAPDGRPEIGLDPGGESLSWHVALPGLHLLAPDLRSERRPDRVMGPAGWRALEGALARIEGGRVLLVSSVPALGPRLSWIERAMLLFPAMQKYEDDLRDQWQSRAHRDEWRRFLERLAEVHARPDTAVTVLSGEIHLATRGTLDVAPAPLHQLVASGIAHPPPPGAWAGALGLLARLGEQPLPGHPIRLHPLPGRRGIYAADRNFLELERRDGRWTAVWELEASGRTPALAL